ncbi:glycosyltransferase [Opitutaceae bacterium TAV4]|nr:glycosyltransferase [Opitutaceae bacterium TAV4]RRK01567.1 glycosyltransferase [Opitutaceae bacterium TAV3]
METNLISIIIPAYNADKYIARCLDALLAQTYGNWEAMVVDNNSADNTAGIIKNYAQKDPRIKYFLQPIKGPAAARNMGLDNAQGEFIMFCDSDDFYEPDMCKEMLAAIQRWNVELVMCDCNQIMTDEANQRRAASFAYHYSKIFGLKKLKDKEREVINVVLWNKIFKKEILDKYKIRFPVGYEFDDRTFIIEYVSIIEHFYSSNKKLYNYIYTSNSIMDRLSSRRTNNRIYDSYYSMEFVCEFMREHGLLEKRRQLLLAHLHRAVGIIIGNAYSDNEIIKSFTLFHKLLNTLKGDYLKSGTELLRLIMCGDFNSAMAMIKTWNAQPKPLRRIFCFSEFASGCKVLGFPFLDYYYNEKGMKANLFGLIRLWRKNFNVGTLCIEQIKMQKSDIKIPNISPAFENNNIAIVLCADDRVINYLCVALQSIIVNSSAKNNYDIVILSSIRDTSYNIRRISTITTPNNVSLRLVNIDEFLNGIDMSSYFSRSELPKLAYTRIFFSTILSKYAKILYLDTDVVTDSDVAELYNIDIRNHAVGAVRDFGVSTGIVENYATNQFSEYAASVLNISDTYNYFNSGVLLMNLDFIRQYDLEKKFVEMASINNRFYMDQNVLNSILRDNVLWLHPKWNFQQYSYAYDGEIYEDFFGTEKNIVHFCAPDVKPLKRFGKVENAVWWKYARQLPFYENIISEIQTRSGDVSSSNQNSSTSAPRLPSLNKFIYRKYIRNITPLNAVLKWIKIVK